MSKAVGPVCSIWYALQMRKPEGFPGLKSLHVACKVLARLSTVYECIATRLCKLYLAAAVFEDFRNGTAASCHPIKESTWVG